MSAAPQALPQTAGATPPPAAEAAKPPHVTVRGLEQALRRTVIYDNFDLDIPRGELISVFGPNGCGKSTLINMIAGLIPPDAGQILFDGMRLDEIKFGYVFQNYREALFPWLRAFDNIAYPLKLMRVPPARTPRPHRDAGRASRHQARPQPLSLSDVRRTAATGLDHARAGGRAGNPVPRRAVLGARLRDDAVHARAIAAHLSGDRHDHGAGVARSRRGGVSRRPCAAAVAASGAGCRIPAGHRGAAAHRRHPLRPGFRAHQGACLEVFQREVRRA